jgi:hypothetical protein
MFLGAEGVKTVGLNYKKIIEDVTRLRGNREKGTHLRF